MSFVLFLKPGSLFVSCRLKLSLSRLQLGHGSSLVNSRRRALRQGYWTIQSLHNRFDVGFWQWYMGPLIAIPKLQY